MYDSKPPANCYITNLRNEGGNEVNFGIFKEANMRKIQKHKVLLVLQEHVNCQMLRISLGIMT
jgi:uncharacterized protein YrzB (UPF0473 family)